jgi:hypothetical protein
VMEKHLIDGRNVSCYVLILNNLDFDRYWFTAGLIWSS